MRLAAILFVAGCVGGTASQAEQHLGGDATCGRLNSSTFRCVRGGVRYECVVNKKRVACAVIGQAQAEVSP